MRKLILGAAIAAMAVPAAPVLAQDRWDHHDDRDHRDDRDHHDDHDRNDYQGGYNNRDDRHGSGWNRNDWQRGRNYDWNRPDPRYGGYDAARYYHSGNYRERRLSRNDRIYRGSDGRYYCRRNDGTTGLLVGAVAGGVLGNVISNGHSSTIATLLGAGGGALLGQSIDRGNVRCR